jgi:hypothetical protein
MTETDDDDGRRNDAMSEKSLGLMIVKPFFRISLARETYSSLHRSREAADMINDEGCIASIMLVGVVGDGDGDGVAVSAIGGDSESACMYTDTQPTR